MPLNRDRILDTAFTLLNQYGLADLSMRRLATELGVAPGALYYHVKNKQELLASLASRILNDVPFPAEQGKIDRIFADVYSHLIPVKEAAEVVRLALALDPNQLQFLDHLTAYLAHHVDSQQAPLAALTLVHAALGFIEQDQTRCLLGGSPLPTEAPLPYRQAIRAVFTGFLK
ncbi:TetR/AcrR family transcriptional regulator [Rothia endophytica]|uniref:TetR/AcrR family transcriptional regulator n=1 Tax=Rothia endophytica TaxID=1324766 RepID=UPI001F020A6E|nr:TetR/AcrR family transcriptional regulator [Rothia endophytica]